MLTATIRCDTSDKTGSDHVIIDGIMLTAYVQTLLILQIQFLAWAVRAIMGVYVYIEGFTQE